MSARRWSTMEGGCLAGGFPWHAGILPQIEDRGGKYEKTQAVEPRDDIAPSRRVAGAGEVGRWKKDLFGHRSSASIAS